MLGKYLSAWWEIATKDNPKWIEIPSFFIGIAFDLVPDMPDFVPYSFYAIFLFFLIIVSPYLVFKKLAIKNEVLQKQLEPNIEVDGPFIWTEPKLTVGKALRTYRLRIKNTSSELVKNCQVKLIEMFNKNDDSTREDGIPFKIKTDNPLDSLNMGYEQNFDISPNTFIDVDIIRFDERKENNNHIQMLYATKKHQISTNMVPVNVCPHTMVIRASAENCPKAVDKKYKFWVNDVGLLKMEEIS